MRIAETIMADDRLESRLSTISSEISILSEKLSNQKKDGWDRLSALSPFIGGVLVAGVGLYFTVTSQKRQIEINEVDLAVKFFPYIISKDNDTRAQAFSVIQAVGADLLITRLAPLGGKAAEQALITVQNQSSDPDARKSAQEALLSVRAIADVQKALGLPPDGILGPQTRVAIVNFQVTKGLNGSGVIDSRTKALLDEQLRRLPNAAK